MNQKHVREIVRELFTRRDEGVYAVLDGARDPRVQAAVRDSGMPHACLYAGALPTELAEVAPYLVTLRRDHPFTRELLEGAWGQSWGVFVRGPLDLEEARRHLRRFLRVRTEDGKTLVFRYYDPRVLRVYLPTCTPSELRDFFGPLRGFAMEAEDPAEMIAWARMGDAFGVTQTTFDDPPLVRALGAREVDPWTALERVSDLAGDLLAESATPVLRLFAPAFVALDEHETLPVTVAQSLERNEVTRGSLERATIVVVDLQDDTVRVDDACPRRGERAALPPGAFAGSLDPSIHGRVAEVVSTEVRTRLGIRWAPRSLVLRALVCDRASAPFQVVLGAARSTFDPAVAAFADAARARAAPSLIIPEPGLAGAPPRYDRSAASPGVPGANGIALSADRVVRLTGGAQCLLHGSFRLPLRSRHIAAAGAGFAAVVPITLVVTSTEGRAPIAVAMQVPSYEAFDPAHPPESITGHFTVDLLSLAIGAEHPQTYFVYAFSGESMGGPVPCAIVRGDVFEHPIQMIGVSP